MADLITFVTEEGQVIRGSVMGAFEDDLSGKNYVIYTDNTVDNSNKLRFYAAIYNPTLPNPFIGEPTTKEEWTTITNIVDNIIPINY